MKTSFSTNNRRHSRQGSAIIIVLVLLAIMIISVAANFTVVGQLKNQVKAIDKKQQQRWQPVPPEKH